MKMNQLVIFSLLVMGLMFTACKSDGTDQSRDSVTTPAAADVAINPDNAGEVAVPVGPLTKIKFENTVFDFGEVMDGERVSHVFKFTNDGKEPLVINNAKASCGCTVPDWTKAPVPPGGTGEIRIEYDSRGKGAVGGKPESKRVTVTANTDPANTYLTVKGIVVKEDTPNS